jgi:hypothetical protein
LEPGSRLTVAIGDLPVPSWLDRAGDKLVDADNWRVAIPSAVGLVMAVLLVYALGRGPGRVPAMAGGQAGSFAGAGSTGGPAQTPAVVDSARLVLVREVASLDDSFQRNELSEEEYNARRAELMDALLRLSLGSGAPGRGEV